MIALERTSRIAHAGVLEAPVPAPGRLGRGGDPPSMRRPRPLRVRAGSGSIRLAERYFRLGRLGQGSQGIAYLCGDRKIPEGRVVIKLAHGSPQALDSLAVEVEALAALQGAAGVPELTALLYRHGELRGFVTPYLAGVTLEELLARERIGRDRVVSLARALGEAVLAIVSRGYIHRDLKPENLLCLEGDRVQIIDFGLARRASDGPSRGELSGTLAYASPEQLEGKSLNARSDLFSLGVVLYELATGRAFFPRGSRRLSEFVSARNGRLERPIALEGVRGDLADLIRRLIVRRPWLRAGVPEVRTRLLGLAA